MARLAASAAIIAMAAWPATAPAEAVAPGEVSFEDGAVAQSLTGQPGDPEKGRQWFAARKLGNCLACHKNADLEGEPFHGEVGPPLDGAGDRWSEAELRGLVVNSKKMFEGTIMPAFYVDTGFNRVREQFEGQTILEPQQVEDIVAYLKTLTE